MTFSVAIIASVLAYTWVLQPIAPRWTAALVAAIVIALALARAARAGEWGIAPSHFAPSLLLAAIFTAAATGVLVAAGSSRHRWHTPSLTAADAGFLLLWALGQQFALQVTLLREAQPDRGARLVRDLQSPSEPDPADALARAPHRGRSVGAR
ncbi:MAG: hypothetical protein JF610_04260 [Acidobacteria bacterium]|nr:hypothetical protein [Acidobacteriota bacterium]